MPRGKLAHELQLLSLRTLWTVLYKKRHCSEKPAHGNKEQPPLEKAYAQQGRPSAAKSK